MLATVNTTASRAPSDGGGDVDEETVSIGLHYIRTNFNFGSVGTDGDTNAHHARASHWSCLHLALCNDIFKSPT